MAAALTVFSKFGFALQSGQGVEATSDPIWLPFVGSLELNRNSNPEPLELADRCNFDRLVYPKCKYWAGSVTVLLCPGAAHDLIDHWIKERDAYSQGRWATVWVVDGLGAVRTAADVKIASASFEFSTQNAVSVSLSMIGISDGTNVTPTDYDQPTLVAPYIFKDAVVTHKPYATGSYESIHCKSLSINIEEFLDSPEDGLRLNGSYFPATLYNSRVYRVTGTLERDYQTVSTAQAYWVQNEDATIDAAHDWNEDTYDGEIGVGIVRGAGTIAISIPHVRYTDWSPRITGGRAGVQTEVAQFMALTDSTGVTAPLTLSATGG